MTVREFVDGICLRLAAKGFSKKAVAFHRDRLTEVYEASPIFEELEIDDEFDDEEFEDGIKHLPVVDTLPDPSLPFVVLKKTHDEQIERRIHQLRDHYVDVQEDRDEVWFPEGEAETIDAIDERGLFGRTVLIVAALEGDLVEVDRLLNLGADYGIKDSSGNDALQVAILNGHDEVADRIREEINKFPFG